MPNKKVKTIVFPVGGLGTRFLPATKSTPKEMLPVAEKPLIQYAFEEAQEAGIERFIFVTGRNKNSIEDHFDMNYELESKLKSSKKEELLLKTNGWLPSKPGQIIFLRQRDTLGLGHAILCAEKYVGDEPFAVSLADELFYNKDTNLLREMMDIYEKADAPANVVAVQEVKKKEDVSKYGIVSIEKDLGTHYKLNDLVEKPKVEDAPSDFSITGKYVFDSRIFEYIKQTQPGAGGEIQITDAMKLSIKDYHNYAYKMTGQRFDCGSIIGYLQANVFYALQNPKTAEATKQIITDFYNNLHN